jgi:hypothetical protein
MKKKQKTKDVNPSEEDLYSPSKQDLDEFLFADFHKNFNKKIVKIFIFIKTNFCRIFFCDSLRYSSKCGISQKFYLRSPKPRIFEVELEDK